MMCNVICIFKIGIREPVDSLCRDGIMIRIIMLNLRFYWAFRHFVGHSDGYRVTFSTDRNLAEPVILVFINYMYLQDLCSETGG